MIDIKITRVEPATGKMGKNSHRAATYSDWCKAEAARTGMKYVEKYRATVNGRRVNVESDNDGARLYCWVERV